MSLIIGALVSILLAIVGAGAWTAVAYFLNMELGILAWGIGFASGFGMAAGGKGRAGVPGGVVAAAVALLAIAGGKYATAYYTLQHTIGGVTPPGAIIQQDFAYQVEDEMRRDGKKLSTPANADDPAPEAAAEAKRRWGVMTPEQRDSKTKDLVEMRRKYVEATVSAFDVFKGSLGGFDVLWAVLAVLSAFQLGKVLLPARPHPAAAVTTGGDQPPAAG